MKDFVHFALSIAVAVVFLAGCGRSQPPTGFAKVPALVWAI